MIRFLWSAALAAVLGLVAIYLYALRLRRTTMFFPLRYPEGSWETSSLPVPPREHWNSTPDGLR